MVMHLPSLARPLILDHKLDAQVDIQDLLHTDDCAAGRETDPLARSLRLSMIQNRETRYLYAKSLRPIDVTQLITRQCLSGTSVVKFIVTGQGGVPQSPSDPLTGDATEVNLVPLNDSQLTNLSSTSAQAITHK
jgi:hypothetical protein